MPEPSDDIFEFDPTSFWEELPNYDRVNLAPVTNQDPGDVVYISAEELKTQSEQEIIAEVDKYYYRYNLFKNNLYPEQIKETAQWLRDNSKLLSLVAAILILKIPR